MSTTVNVPLAYTNVRAPDPIDQRHATITATLDRVNAKGEGLAAFVEANLDQAYIRAAAASRGMSTVGAGELAIVYDRTRYALARPPGNVRIMVGGHVGADGVATPRKGDDDRRVGPSRWLLSVELTILGAAAEFGLDLWHPLAQVDTSNKWRRALWAASARIAGIQIAARRRLTPNRLLIGDTNRNIPRVDIPGLPEVEVPSPATMGRARYDRAHRMGALTVAGNRLTAFSTHSDHKGLEGTLVVPTGPSSSAPVSTPTQPPAVRPAPPKPAKLRRPVPFPWRAKWNPSRLLTRARRAQRAGRRAESNRLRHLAARVEAWRRQNPRRRRR